MFLHKYHAAPKALMSHLQASLSALRLCEEVTQPSRTQAPAASESCLSKLSALQVAASFMHEDDSVTGATMTIVTASAIQQIRAAQQESLQTAPQRARRLKPDLSFAYGCAELPPLPARLS